MNKIIEFFKRIFKKKQVLLEASQAKNITVDMNTQNSFIENMKAKYNENTDADNMNLFVAFRMGKIKEEELSKEQVEIISGIYDKKIAEERAKAKHIKKKLEASN